jgi:pyruvate dehydrogenase E1 component beta subunit
VFVAGEDVGAFGGVFHTFDGLQKEFGEDRVVDTPISEQAIIGLGLGAAVSGLRPIVDLMFMDFICVAMDQIVNQVAKIKYMFGGAADRAADDHRRLAAPASRPRRSTARASKPSSATSGPQGRLPVQRLRHEGLMTACIREDNPTVMVKHKRLFGSSSLVPEEPYTGAARQGRDRSCGHRMSRSSPTVAWSPKP